MRTLRLLLAPVPVLALFVACASAPASPDKAATAPAAVASTQAAALPEAAPGAPDPLGGASSGARAAIAKASDFAKVGKWLTAYKTLDAFDAKNADPWVLAAKTDICLRGYVRSELHQAFALVDLANGQDLGALRTDANEYETFSFDPVAAAEAIEQGGASLPALLAGALGDYYYEAQDLFSDAWVLSDEEICTNGIARYEAAAKGGVESATQLTRRAEMLVRFSRLDEAQALIEKALVLEPSNADAHFALAIVHAQGGKAPECLAEVDRALAAYKDKDKKFNAYLFGARVAAESDEARAESYLAAAEKEYPSEPSPALVRHLVAVQLGKADAAVRAADAAQDLFPDSPYVVRTILSTWLDAQDLESAMAWIDHASTRMAGKDAALGVLGFYKALLIAQSQGEAGIEAARTTLMAAEASFKKAYSPDNQVFEAIAQLYAQLDEAAASLAAEKAASAEGQDLALPGAAQPGAAQP